VLTVVSRLKVRVRTFPEVVEVVVRLVMGMVLVIVVPVVVMRVKVEETVLVR